MINALNLASARPDPFSTFEFYENLLRRSGSLSGGTRSRVWFLAAFSERELIGYLALEEVTDRVLWRPIKRLGFLVAHDVNRPHVVAQGREHRRRDRDVLLSICGPPAGMGSTELQQQDSASTLYPPPPGVNLTGCWVRHWPNLDNGTIRIRGARSKSTSTRRAQVPLEFPAPDSGKLLASGVKRAADVVRPRQHARAARSVLQHRKRGWKSATELTVGGTPERLDYFRALLDARQPMQAVIQVLVLDGVPRQGSSAVRLPDPRTRVCMPCTSSSTRA
jgi:hypothetical protein